MKPRDAIRGAITGMLIALALITGGGTESSGLAAETQPSNDILLVDGQIPDGKPAAFDLARLKTLPLIAITTATPWTEGENRFEGVLIRDVLDRVGAKGKAVTASAVDEYRSPIPAEDIQNYDVIIANAMNGQLLPADDKGPLWIVYPFSAHFGLQKDLYFSRSVWQLKRLTVQ